jgi:hypothetical protein
MNEKTEMKQEEEKQKENLKRPERKQQNPSM